MEGYQFQEKMSEFNSSEDIHFNSLSSLIPQIFSFIDPLDYSIKYINKVEDGYQISDVIGKSIFNYILPEHHEIYLTTIESVKKTGKALKIDVGFFD
jgi:hypothetical protein